MDKMKIQEFKNILDNWNLGRIKSIKRAEKGEVNNNWFIETEKGRFVLRRVTSFKKSEDLNFELDYLEYLKNKNFQYKIPLSIKTKNNQRMINYNGSFFWLYLFIEGEMKRQFQRPELEQLAKMISSYHTIIEKSNFNNRRPSANDLMKKAVIKELVNFRKRLKKKSLRVHGKNFMGESEVLVKILRNLNTDFYEKIPKYALHRDLNPENLLWKDRKLFGILDFDNVSQINDSFIKDLSIIIQYGCSKNHKININQAKILLREYKKYRNLSNNEIRYVPIIICAGYIEDFSYAYWLLINDPKRAKESRLTTYSHAAQGYYKNQEKISRELTT